MKKTLYLFILLILSAGILLMAKSTLALSTPSKLKGKILLQVESKGEAWYLFPADGKRYSMGRPNDAFNLMRQLGIGISNDNLKKIKIANENLTGRDSDNDGLSDMAEDAIGTDKNKSDSDADGYSDKNEIIGGYDPSGSGKLSLDNNFSKSQSGKILLQVEGHGEAWYVNPDNYQRYFMGRPGDAFNLMRKLGLGITNNDLNKIVVSNVDQNNITGCRAFMIDNGIKKCLEYYLPDYAECNKKSDCSISCPNCIGGTQDCVDLGKRSFGINNEIFDYSKYEHYKKCEECSYSFSESTSAQCKEGYRCVTSNKCEPTFETECKSQACPYCVSGLEKYINSQNGISVCYDCDTNADCVQGYVCSNLECVPAS